MTNLLKFFSFFIMVILVSCSSGQSLKEENAIDSADESVALEDENQYEEEDSIYEEQYTDDTIEQAPEEVASAPEMESQPAEETSSLEASSDPMLSEEPTAAVAVAGNIINYEVKKTETMMLIAFNLYGDYEQWRKIKELNPEVSPYKSLQAGQVIKVVEPTEKFVWAPSGNPYLIKRNDTLSSISSELYQTPNHWKDLYHHNQPLIKDPNKIFAGFTIYYLDVTEYNRQPANN